METASTIRMRMRRIREALPDTYKKEQSDLLCEKISNLNVFTQAETVLLYYPLAQEVDVLPIFLMANQKGKRTAFPKTRGTQITFYEADLKTAFKEGTFHVMEPQSDKDVYWEEGIVIVPGVAFDVFGGRLGYGKGCYDRFLCRQGSLTTIGVCFDEQVYDGVLTLLKTDVLMDYVVTPTRIINCRGNDHGII